MENKTKEIQPFAIDCRKFDKPTVQMIIDKMKCAGIKEYETLESYSWNMCDCWGYNRSRGTYTADIEEIALHFGGNLITLDQLDVHLGKNTCTELRNVKIDLRKEDGSVDEELSKAFQEAVFEGGGSWESGKESVQLTNKKFLFVSCTGEISFSDSPPTFDTDNLRQIHFSYERKLEWSAEFVETKQEREIITLPNGDQYYAEDLQKALSMIKKIEE